MWIFIVNSDWEFLEIPNCNNSGSKTLEIPRNSKLIANRTWNSYRNSNSEHQWLSLKTVNKKNLPEIPRNFQECLGMFKNYWEFKAKKSEATNMKEILKIQKSQLKILLFNEIYLHA